LTVVADDLSAWKPDSKDLGPKVSLAGRADVVFSDIHLVGFHSFHSYPLFLYLEVLREEEASMQLGLVARCQPALKG